MRRRFDPSRNFRQGFTLLELMLVLGLLVMVGAIAWPSIQKAYEGIRLKKTAEQVMAAFGHARVLAMSTGVSQVFRFEPGSGQYTMMAMPDDSAGVDSDASGATSATAGSASPGTSSSPGTSTTATDSSANSSAANSPNPNGPDAGNTAGTCAHQLTDGFIFSKGERVLDTRAALAESELPSSGSSDGATEAAPPVLFYSDGTTSDATVTVSDKSGRSISVSLRGLTGVARMGDIFSAETTQ
jgi:prepilin-type N-terminal cleavage/methylation domain-containing protein